MITRAALGCRLCWTITGAVFAMILIIESLILVPSARRFESEALRLLAVEAQGAVDAVLAPLAVARGAPDLRPALEPLVGRLHIRGLAALRADGSVAAAVGELLQTAARSLGGAVDPSPAILLRSEDGSRVEVSWRNDALGAAGFAARLDASHVRGALRAYVLRIAGLVALIVLVVTAGTMLVLHVLLLKPLMRLRESMRLAAQAPERASEYSVPSRRSDELGEMIVAHNSMLSRIVESIRRDREVAEARARILSHHDGLTGLPNRRSFLEHLSGRRAGDGAAPGVITVCIVNVVQLRRVNAAMGQQTGDRLLWEVGVRVSQAAGAGSFVAHLGAGRFAVARRSGDPAFDAAGFAERILRDAAGEYSIGGDSVAADLRVGISHAPCAACSPEELLNQAELALERAGAEDSGGYAFFENAMAEAAHERRSLSRALERAIGRDDELFLAYQAKASLSGDGMAFSGAEALLRWRHPERGLVRPDVFIALAEATGLILPLGEKVLRRACAQVRDWLERHGRSPRVAVNLSAHQFVAPGLVGLVAGVLRETGIPPALLELEVTESAAMRDAERAASRLHELHELGVCLAIDDFGTGYSSLNYLRRFALDTIKIDKSFVDDIGKDPNAEAICAAILGMARALGRHVVAEGVETEMQLAFLRSHGCDEIQGYLYARPEPAAEFERRFLQTHAALRVAR
ncbi:MAG: hypothetical protein A3H32_04935 [Betaproteobacteria bacterium RIFCSPLOWO2_02_FULL_63_19]|nr:MAG: hypothetical protein A3H32_04935 [Betaproteobacteria bacterium RIFCSPLOWO2_02_FULL_63_19]